MKKKPATKPPAPAPQTPYTVKPVLFPTGFDLREWWKLEGPGISSDCIAIGESGRMEQQRRASELSAAFRWGWKAAMESK